MGTDSQADQELLAEFLAFRKAKAAQNSKGNAEAETVEVWDQSGRGARVSREMARPFLEKLGLDVSDIGDKDDDDNDDDIETENEPVRRPGRRSQGPSRQSGAEKFIIGDDGKDR